MTRILLLLLCLVCATALCAAQAKNSREAMGFLGPVRSAEFDYEVRLEDQTSATKLPSMKVDFDERGNKTGDAVYDEKGIKRKTGWSHEYDEKGRGVKTYYYDAKGNLTNTGLSVYDDKGRCVQRTQINPNGSINHYQSFAYDDHGNRVSESHRNPDGSPRGSMVRVYDSKGNEIETSYFNASGELEYKTESAFDEHGTRTLLVTTRQGKRTLMMKRKYSYDNRGNYTELVEYDQNDSVTRKEKFSYDEFDKSGNWIKRTISREALRDGQWINETETDTRKLTYF
jgi:hypothetical protein